MKHYTRNTRFGRFGVGLELFKRGVLSQTINPVLCTVFSSSSSSFRKDL